MPLLFEDKSKSHCWYRTDLYFPAHLHRAVEIGIVEAGQCILNIEGETFVAEQGDVFVIFPNLIHSYDNCVSKTLLCIITTLDLKAFAPVFRESVPVDPVIRKGQLENSSLRTLLSLFAGDVKQETDAVLQGYYQTIFGKCLSLLTLSQRKEKHTDDLRNILTYINDHCTEDITRKSLAKAVGISESTVSGIFANTLKMSLPEYLKSIRIREAAKLLRETKLSVTEVAEISGFGSIRSFNRAFSECFHTSPSAYRNEK